MMDAGGHTYSRYGSQDHRHSSERMSIPGLKKAMREVLALHAKRKPGESKPATAKPLLVQDYPAFRRTKAAGEECYHCHYANNARFAQMRLEGAFAKEKLFQYPLPENIGIELDVDANNVVRSVTPGSPAEKAGVRPGDVLTGAGSAAVITPADLQFVLDAVPDPGSITLRLARDGREIPSVSLSLPRGWRRADISWRPSQGGVPPTIGIWAKPLSDAEKRERGIPPGRLGLLVNFMFPGPDWAKTRGDLRANDVIIGLDGKELPSMNTRQFHSRFRLRYDVGQTVTVNVIREGKRVDVRVPCLDVGEE
jgi:hypothetical protein